MKEYRDGILLFTLMEKKVWKKAVEDTVGLKKYYEDHKDDFKADETIDVVEYRSTDIAALNKVDQMLTDVGQRQLQDIPQMESIRRGLLEKALSFYLRFLEDQSAGSAVLTDTARAYNVHRWHKLDRVNYYIFSGNFFFPHPIL